MFLVFVLVCLNFLPSQSQDTFAATGINHQINFQGKLVNPNGTNVADGNYSIVFSLYNVASGGTAVWAETQSVSVTNGIFQVNLGSVTPLPGSVDFNTDNIYLGIKVGSDPEMAPRIRFTAVPQAFNAEKLGGISASGFIQNGTNPQTANFNVTGTGVVGTSLTTPALQSASGTALTITANASSTWGTSGNNNLSIQAGGTGVLSLDSGTTGAINVGTNANAKTVNIGNSTGATSVVINCGTGACNLGTNAVAHTTTVGSSTGGATTTIQSGTGGINLNGAVSTSSTINSNTFSGSALTFGAAAAATINSANNQNLTIQAPGTGSLTLSSGNGTITTASAISALATNASGYKTTNTGGSYAGQWTLLGTCAIPLQSLACHTQALIANVSDGQTVLQRALVDIRVKQQAAMGSAPQINLELLEASGIMSNDIAAVVAQNDATATTVQIWGRINDSNMSWAISPLINTDSVGFNWMQNQGFQVSLPTAPTTYSAYADSMVGSLQVNDALVVDDAGQLTSSALLGTYSGALTFNNTSNVYYGSGANLTNLNAGNITSGILSTVNGGTGTNGVGPAGSIAFSDGSAYAFTSVGSSGQCLQSTGATMPTWSTCSNGATTVGALDGGTLNANGGYITSATLYLQSASTNYAGLVNTGNQSFAGDKTFTGSTVITTDSTAAFQIQDANNNAIFTTDTTNGYVGIGNSTPRTLLDVGVSSGASYPATSHPGTYSCNPGDSLSGTTCTNVTTYAATYNAGYYYCPSGGTLSGTTCQTGSYAASYQSGYYYCPSGGSLSGTTCTYTYAASCASGYYTGTQMGGNSTYCYTGATQTASGSTCPGGTGWYWGGQFGANTSLCYQGQMSGGSHVQASNCPSGGTASNGTCTYVYSASYQSAYYYCPSGGTLSGTTCYTSYNASYSAPYYTCNAGDSLSGSTCSHSTTYAATQGPTTYSCTPPDTLNGTLCTTTNAISALFEGKVGVGTGTVTPLTYTKPGKAGGAFSLGTYAGYSDSCASYSSAMGDFNGDGTPDIVYVCASSAVYVALGTGSGGFGTSTAYTTSLSTTYSVVVGDFNGDGKLDIAAASYGNSTVDIFAGNGDGTFNTTPTVISVGFNPWSITTGDFNGDGKRDFAVSSTSTTLGIFINNGSGTAFTQTNITTNYAMNSAGTGDVTTADINGDGKLDLLAISYNSYELMVLTNSGSGTSYTEADYATGTYPYDIGVGDFNGDGKPDVAVPNYNSNTISTYLNNGSGGFTVNPTFSSTYASPSSVAVGDFNGDGKYDLAVGNYNTTAIAVFLSNGDGTFGAANTYSVGYSYPQKVQAADMNGDGKPDIVVPSRNSAAISVLINQTVFPIASVTGSGTLSIKPTDSTSAGLILQANSNQTGRLVDIQDAANNSLLSVDATGAVRVSSTTTTVTAQPFKSQNTATPSSSSSNYTMGYNFTPTVNGKVTQLGVRCTAGSYTMDLWTTSGTNLATTTVNATGTAQWVYGNITPVSLTAGTSYVVSAYSPNGYYCYQSFTMPVTAGGVTINDSQYNGNNGHTFPNSTSTTTTMYGEADITFQYNSYADISQYMLDVNGNNSSGYVANIQNTSTSTTADGLLINLGANTATRTTTNYYIGFAANGTVAGKIYGNGASVAYVTSGADYAEYFRADESNLPQPGELLTLDGNNSQTVKLASDANKLVVGAVSTSPGFIGNGPICKTDDKQCDKDYAKYNVLVALSGQVPVKVSTANGSIAVGDPITASSTSPGVGVKATGPGYIVGYALEPASQDGTIKVLINPSYLDATQQMQGSNAIFNSVVVNGALSAESINVGGLASVASLQVDGDATVGGNLTVDGNTTFGGNISLGEHLLSQASTPTVIAGVAAGKAGQVSIDGTDTAGTITITVHAQQGAQPEILSAGDLAAVTFAKSYQEPPRVVISPINQASVGLPIYITKTDSGYKLVITQAAQDGITYQFDYIIIGSSGQSTAQ